MRIITLPLHPGFKIYAEAPAAPSPEPLKEYTSDDVLNAIQATNDKSLVPLMALYSSKFQLGKDTNTVDQELMRAMVASGLGPESAAQVSSRALVWATTFQSAIAFGGLMVDLEVSVVLNPIRSRISDIQKFCQTNDRLLKRIRDLSPPAKTEEVKQQLLKVKEELEKTAPNTTSAPSGTSSPAGKQQTDKEIQKRFKERETAILNSPEADTLPDRTMFTQAMEAVAIKYAEIISENAFARDNVDYTIVNSIAQALGNALLAVANAKTPDQQKAVVKAVNELERVWPGAGNVIKRIQAKGGQLLKLLATFCQTKEEYHISEKLLMATHQKFRTHVVSALQSTVSSCETKTQCVQAFQPHKNLLDKINSEGDNVLGQPRTINDVFSKSGDRFGPGEMMMAKDVILNSISKKNYFDKQKSDEDLNQTDDDQTSNKILGYVASYGKTGGLIDWTDAQCSIPNDWAHPGVILFGSIVLWVLARMVQTGER